MPLDPETPDDSESGGEEGDAPDPQTPPAATPPEAANPPQEENPPSAQNPSAPPVQTPPPNQAAQCVSYESGFLPLVHDPVCSNCHTGAGNSLPAFEPFAQAQRRCNQIGREVASGSMPPGGGLSAAQRETVALWVSIGCPETDAAAAQICAQNPPNPGNGQNAGNAPPAQGGGDDDDDDDDDDREDDDDDDDDDD